MRPNRLAPAIAAIALLGACEARIGNDAPPIAENATAEGRAEEGRVTIEAPGFNMSINIPEGLRSEANMDDNEGLIYPGASFSGIHVLGRSDENKAAGERSEVELRFTSGDGIDRVVAWYRDPARAPEFTIASAAREGDGFVLRGTRREDNGPFTLRLAQRGSGVDARLLLVDND
jgi:hypothetical protein